MNKQEAIEWMEGKRSATNTIQPEPYETWQIRIAQADAAYLQQAYWILRHLREQD